MALLYRVYRAGGDVGDRYDRVRPTPVSRAAPPVRGMAGATRTRRWLPWLVPALVLGLWQAATAAGLVPSRVLPRPTDVALAAWVLLRSGGLGGHLLASAGRALAGFAIGGTVGFVLGLANGSWRAAEHLLDTSVQMVRNIPHLALLPLVILWFGLGEEAKIFLVALGVFFPLYVNTFHGVRSVDPGLLEMARVFQLSRWALFRRVIFPGAIPSVLVGVRFGLGVMWLTLIVAETLGADSGIGYLAMNAR